MTTSLCRRIAETAHAGQVDRAGRNYFEAHLAPIAEAAAVFGPEAEAAAWLHDVIEDTGTTAEQLAEQGISAEVISAVEAVTRRDGESYTDMIERACEHPLGRLVKLVDNAWNITSSPVLVPLEPGKAGEMLSERYLPARDRLLSAAGLTLQSAKVVDVQKVLHRHHARLNDAWEAVDVVSGNAPITEFRRRARLVQTNYRLSTGSPPGEYRGRVRGAVFDERWLSDHPGANFLSATIHEEVRRRLETRQGQETVDVDRLERHLLSSMPLCFNLFGELPTQPDRLSAFGERLLGTPTTGQAVCFEWSPGRGALEFTNDRTAFDVALSFDTAGGPQLVGIETKYHEVAEAEEPPNPQTRMPRYREIVAAGLDGRPVFEPDWEQRILGSPLQQLWRDHLLLLTAVQSASTPWTGGKYVLVHPAGNPSFADAAEEYADALVDDSTFATMTVEEVLDAGVLTPETEARFRARYLW